LLGVQEVPSSNLGGPTKYFKDLPREDHCFFVHWSPSGVQTANMVVVSVVVLPS
jgi:hypothetical protein